VRTRGPIPLSRVEVAEWVVRCAAAETIGMTAAAAAARAAGSLLTDTSTLRTAAAWTAVVGAGCVEAFAVGVAQSGALRRRVPCASGILDDVGGKTADSFQTDGEVALLNLGATGGR
jgi:hypothetical protein